MTADAPSFDTILDDLDRARSAGKPPIPAFKEALRLGTAELEKAFDGGVPIVALVGARARLVDELILRGWASESGENTGELALVAVGGYGRGELHPRSDIDFTILMPDGDTERFRAGIEGFVTFLWDIGLEVGHSVRTVAECRQEAGEDIATATTFMEARLLDGDAALFDSMQTVTGPATVWGSRAFFEAKAAEQEKRHAKFHHTAYKLEPNVKEGPGGLRDIQTIGWVAKRHFGADTLHDLVGYGFLTDDEYQALTRGQAFLWRVRFGLHVIARRREDRLLFDHQVALAEHLGYTDADHTLSVEQFMQDYYRTIMELSRLNEMLLQLFEEAILLDRSAHPVPLTDELQARHGFVEAIDREVFARRPAALLELFLVLEQNPELKGVSAATIRLIRENRHRVDAEFRRDPECRRLFMAILREPRGVTHELRRMNRYGILGRYIPEFGQIVGRMQFDLFHAYTVDEHTLFVVSNLRRFALPRFDHEFPRCSKVMQQLPKPELAYIAGLFHDIAKGRGGDHSELGAVDAERFCREHGLSRYDGLLVAWLVRNHLLLSMTAQKRDIADPGVIHEFARTVGDQIHLDYLYVLTVADVRATNPELWNSWKETLFNELYEHTKRALRRGLENPIERDELIKETQADALRLLAIRSVDEAAVRDVWHSFSDEYFLRHTADEIAWHTQALTARGSSDAPVILVRRETERGTTAVFVYSRQDDYSFGRATAVLDQLGLSIWDARIVPTHDGHTLYTYVILEDTGEPITGDERVEEIRRTLDREIRRTNATPMTVTRRVPRQVRMFDTQTDISFETDEWNGRTVVDIIAGDRPGLLSRIGETFQNLGIRLQNAKITTVGERAEDIFFVTDRHNQALGSDDQRRLENALEEAISDNTG